MRTKLIRVALGVLLYMTILTITYAGHVRFGRVDVVFYAALQDAFVALVVSAVGLFTIPWFKPLANFEKVQLVAIFALIGYSLAISVPALVDRSLSFYILEKLEQRGGGIQEEAFPRIFTDEYLVEYRLVDVRLTEQLESGTIRIDHGCVRLTAKGRALASGGTWFRENLLPERRLLRDRYTDALTDPFRDSKPASDYRC